MNAFARTGLSLFLFTQLISFAFAQSIINTVAGNGDEGFNGDNRPAIEAELNGLTSVEVDFAGNFYISDTYNNRIRKVDSQGIITTIAGHGTFGSDAEGIPALDAQLYSPTGVAFDSEGNLYIADNNSHRIRRVSPSGIINTVVGTGTAGFSGDDGPAISAQLNKPYAIVIDAMNNLYISDSANNRIRKVTPSGIITTVAGSGSPGYGGDDGPATSAMLSGAFGIDVDFEGNLYIADAYNGRIRMVDSEGIIRTVAGNGIRGFSGDGGPAILAQVDGFGVETDALGNLYIADTYNDRIRKVSPDGIITSVAGNGIRGFSGDLGPPTLASLYSPLTVNVDLTGSLYIADSGNNRIRKISEISSAATFFSQVAVGSGYTTIFTFGNTGSEEISGTLLLIDQQGNPFTARGTVSNPGEDIYSTIDSEFPLFLPPGSVATITLTAVNPNSLSSFWARVLSSGGSLYGVALYKFELQGELRAATGVLPSPLIQQATIPVDDDYIQERFTAYALSNPTDQNLDIRLALVDQEGNLVHDYIDISLEPGEQIARYLHQELNNSHFQFKGSIILRTEGIGAFTAVAFLQNQWLFTVIPVTPGKAPHLPD